jgi:hypothetical protein
MVDFMKMDVVRGHVQTPRPEGSFPTLEFFDQEFAASDQPKQTPERSLGMREPIPGPAPRRQSHPQASREIGGRSG